MHASKLLAAAVALCSLAGAAHAAKNGLMPTVRQQVYAQAKADGITKGLKRPSVRIQYLDGGRKASAQVTALSTFTGGPKRLLKPQRVVEYTAMFRITPVTTGKNASPIKTGGSVWHMMARATGPR